MSGQRWAMPREHIGAVLETRAANDANRMVRRRQAIKRGDHFFGIDRAIEQTDPRMGSGGAERILIAERVRHQRHIAATPRGGGQRSARGGGDQHRLPPIH